MMYKTYIELCKRQWKRIMFGMSLMVVNTIITLRIPFVLNDVLDNLFKIEASGMRTFLVSFMMYFFMLCGTTVIDYFSQIYFKQIGNENAKIVADRLSKKLIYARSEKVDQIDTHSSMVLFNDDIFKLGEGGLMIVYKLIYIAVNVLALLFYMISTNVIMSLGTITVFVLMAILQWYGNRKIKTLIEGGRYATGNYYNIVNTLVNEHCEHLNCNGASYAMASFQKRLDGLIDVRYILAKFTGGITLANGLFIAANVFVVFVGGAYFVKSGAITLSQLITFNTFSSGLGGFIGQIPAVFATKKDFDVSCERIERFNGIPEYEDNGKHMANIGKIALRNVTFSYTEDRRLVNGLNLEFKKGRIYSIIGPNGCGKSTMLNLIDGDYECDEGVIEFDESYVSTHKDKLSIMEHISYFSTKSPLYPDTIYNNICLNGPVDSKRLDVILKVLGLSEWFCTLPDGINTYIFDASTISDGQKQKILLARFLSNLREVILIDEMEKHLDRETKLKIMEYLVRLREEHIIIIVSHDKLVQEHCDEIISIS